MICSQTSRMSRSSRSSNDTNERFNRMVDEPFERPELSGTYEPHNIQYRATMYVDTLPPTDNPTADECVVYPVLRWNQNCSEDISLNFALMDIVLADKEVTAWVQAVSYRELGSQLLP